MTMIKKACNRVGSERLVRSLSSHTTRTYRSVYGGFLLYISRWVDVVFNYPIEYRHSNLFFGFRPILLLEVSVLSI